MTVLFVIYGMAGGLGAAIITDFIQGILTIIFSFLLLPFVFFQIGGFGALHGQAGIKENMLNMVADPSVADTLGKEPITVFYVFMLATVALSGIVVQPHIMGVCGAGKTEYEGRFGFTVGNFLKRFCTIAWTFTGLACIVWYLGSSSPMLHQDKPLTKESGTAFAKLSEDEQQQQLAAFAKLSSAEQKKILEDRKTYAALHIRNNNDEYNKLSKAEQEKLIDIDNNFSDRLFGKAAYDILPTIMPGLVGLLLASLLAAVMSTSDAQMIISSGLFTENIYRRFLVKGRSARHYLWAGRIAGLTIVAIAVIVQSTFPDMIAALKIVIQTPAFIGISLWFGITWRRWNVYSVWVSTFVGLLTWLTLSHSLGWVSSAITAPSEWGLFPEWMFGPKGMTSAWQMFWYMSAGILSGVIVGFVTPMQSQEQLDHFFRLMHTPVTPGEHVPGPCQLPVNPAPKEPKMFANSETIEIPKPTRLDLVGFALAWAGVAVIIGLTMLLAALL